MMLFLLLCNLAKFQDHPQSAAPSLSHVFTFLLTWLRALLIYARLQARPCNVGHYPFRTRLIVAD